MLSMKRFGSLRRSKKRKEQDELGGRPPSEASEASCLCGNPHNPTLIWKSSCNTHTMVPTFWCFRRRPYVLHIAQEAFQGLSGFTGGNGALACPDLNGKAIYRGASELLPPPQGALLLNRAVGGTVSSAGCGFSPQGLVGHVSISLLHQPQQRRVKAPPPPNRGV